MPYPKDVRDNYLEGIHAALAAGRIPTILHYDKDLLRILAEFLPYPDIIFIPPDLSKKYGIMLERKKHRNRCSYYRKGTTATCLEFQAKERANKAALERNKMLSEAESEKELSAPGYTERKKRLLAILRG